jgi:hypothetical protein
MRKTMLIYRCFASVAISIEMLNAIFENDESEVLMRGMRMS